jgi:hypothetical protein
VDIGLLRLAAQHVAGPGLPTPVDAVRHLLAAQGQDPRGVVRSIALRTVAQDGAAVLDAYASGAVVRSWPMRGTLHTVVAEDLGWMLRLMTSRPRAAAARRRPDLGLTEDDVTAAHGVVEAAVADGGATRAQVLAALEAAGQPTSGGRGYHLLVELAQRGVVCLGPYLDGDQLFVLVDEHVGAGRDLDGEAALAELALRYLRGHGPATVADLARWAGLPLGQVRTGLAAVQDRLGSAVVDGTEHWFDPGTPSRLVEHEAHARSVHLLPGFDEMVLGYADRTATVPAEHAERVVPGGNGVFRGTVLHDGVAIGTWVRERTSVVVEPFAPLDPTVQAEVATAVAALP